MVGGLTAATLRRHEKLWTGASSDMGIQTAACSQLAFWNLHDLTTAVPPPNSDRWASLQEIQLWALSHTIKNHDRLPGPGWTSWGSWLGRAGRLLGLTAASSAHLVAGNGSDGGRGAEGQVLPRWLLTASQTATTTMERGVAGGPLLGFLQALIVSREVEWWQDTL